MNRFLQLPNKLVIDVENIAFILNPELNTYVVIPKQSITPAVPKLDGFEYDALIKYLAPDVLVVERPEVPADKRPLIARVDDDKSTLNAGKVG